MRTWLKGNQCQGILMKRLSLLLICLITIILTGCKSEKADVKKIKDLEFTVVEDADVPEELMSLITEKKKKKN